MPQDMQSSTKIKPKALVTLFKNKKIIKETFEMLITLFNKVIKYIYEH